MTVILAAIAGLLALWGFYSLAVLEGFSAVDAASRILIGSAIVLGLAAVARSIDRMRRELVLAAGSRHDLCIT